MRFLITVLFAIGITLIINLFAWLFNDTYAGVAVPLLVGIVSALLAEQFTKEDE